MILTILKTSLKKIVAFFGGRKTLALVCFLLICCFLATSLITNSPAENDVSVAIADLSNGPISRVFCRTLLDTEGIRGEVVDSIAAGEEKLLYDSVEVLLILSPEFDAGIMRDESERLVTLKTAPGTDSAQLLRETVAGLLLAQRSAYRMKEQLADEGFDISSFEQYMAEATLQKLYSVSFPGDKYNIATFENSFLHASYNGVAALALLLILLTLTKRMSDSSSRLVSERLETVQGGRLVSFMGDYTALFLVGFAISALAFVFSPQKTVPIAAAWIFYVLCISALCLLVSRFNTVGRIDILAPFLAILTSVVGGCFTDLSIMGEQWKIVARCVPQGQMLASANGVWYFDLILLGESAIALFVAWIVHSERSHSEK